MLRRLPILTPLNHQQYNGTQQFIQKIAFQLNRNSNQVIETTAIYKKTPSSLSDSIFNPSSPSSPASSLSISDTKHTLNKHSTVSSYHLCLSSQVSCRHDCRHCACARFSNYCKVKSLNVEELLSQIQYFDTENEDHPLLQHVFLKPPIHLTSISLHGQGEPLDNPDVFSFLETLQTRFPLSKISLCTVGIRPSLIKLCTEFPNIHVLWSLHTPFAAQRAHLMPSVESQYPMESILSFFDTLSNPTIHFGYLWMPGNNDSDFHVYALTRLLKKHKRPLCLIRFHPVAQQERTGDDVPSDLDDSSSQVSLVKIEQKLQAFYKKLQKNAPVPVHIQEYFEFPSH